MVLYIQQGSSLDGVTLDESYHMLEDSVSCLNSLQYLSCQGHSLLIEANLKLADLDLQLNKKSQSEVCYKKYQFQNIFGFIYFIIHDVIFFEPIKYNYNYLLNLLVYQIIKH